MGQETLRGAKASVDYVFEKLEKDKELFTEQEGGRFRDVLNQIGTAFKNGFPDFERACDAMENLLKNAG